jgi:hypothetical protein
MAQEESEHLLEKYHCEMFLAADSLSISSHLSAPSKNIPPGDTGPHILAIDIGFDPNSTDEQERREESPGYEGQLRILDSLLWDDVSALIDAQTQHMEDLWPLARLHPEKLYVGPVVDGQKHAWK